MMDNVKAMNNLIDDPGLGILCSCNLCLYKEFTEMMIGIAQARS